MPTLSEKDNFDALLAFLFSHWLLPVRGRHQLGRKLSPTSPTCKTLARGRPIHPDVGKRPGRGLPSRQAGLLSATRGAVPRLLLAGIH